MTAALMRTRVEHARGAPITHRFSHASTAWLVDVGQLGHKTRPTGASRALRRLISFRSGDHLGDPEKTWYENVLAFARTQGHDLSGHRILALTTPRALGLAFNPLTVYWCFAGDTVRCVIAEVHNTYGDRHAYLVEPDETGRASTDKQMYVSPFNDVSGTYRLVVPPPTGDRFEVRISLHRKGTTPYVTSWQGKPAPRPRGPVTVARAVATPWMVTALIRAHGVALWARRLPIRPRPRYQTQESV